jgi:hypothetical protein
MKIGCGQVNAPRGLLLADSEEASRLPQTAKEASTTFDAAGGLERRNYDFIKAVELTTASSELHVQFGA